MKSLKMGDKYLVELQESGGLPELLLAKRRVGVCSSAPTGSDELALGDFIEQVKALEKEINGQLIAMSKPIRVALLALISGENAFFISLPGAAKSTLARLIAEGVQGLFFRVLLNPDNTRNDLIGSLDPAAVQKGVWARKLSGLATAHVALLDEFFKASATVRNMVLSALEEHVVSQPDGDISIPLLLGIAASNEVVDATPKNAAWDRMLFRTQVNYPHKDKDWGDLLGSKSGRKPISTRLLPEDILLIQAYVELMAMSLPKDVKDAMNKVRKGLARNGMIVSPRRFLGWAKAIVAQSLWDGSDTPHVDHIVVGADILWTDPEDITEVSKIVNGVSDPERAVLIQIEADIENITNQLIGLIGREAQTKIARLLASANKLKTLLTKVKGKSKQSEVEEISAQIEGLRDSLMEKAAEIAGPDQR